MEEVLKQAGKDLTRESLIKAAESVTGFECSVCLFTASMSPTDHDPVQAAYLARAEGGRWVRFGNLVSYEGALPGNMTAADLKR